MNIYIWGTGKLGEAAYEKIKENYGKDIILGFIDSDENKWDKEFCNKIIYNPNILRNSIPTGTYIIIASMYYFEIVEQLIQYGDYRYQSAPELMIIKDCDLLLKINKSKLILFKKLEQLEIKELKISDYNKKYLLNMKKNKWNILNIYGEILFLLLDKFEQIDNNVKFLDYGGGTGLLSLLASELGIIKVYYNDIYDISVYDSKIIAEQLGYLREDYICGDINEIIAYCEKKDIKFNLLGSYDVLEHIYNLDTFFKSLIRILSENSHVIMCSSANSYNTDIVKEHAQYHYEVEYNNQKIEYGHKERDSIKSYYNLRKNIIEEFLKNNNVTLEEECIKDIAFFTRGKIKEDTIAFVKEFLNRKIVHYSIDKFISNTCDPLNGNWAEHLIDFEELKESVTGIYGIDNVYILPQKGKKNASIISFNIK